MPQEAVSLLPGHLPRQAFGRDIDGILYPQGLAEVNHKEFSNSVNGARTRAPPEKAPRDDDKRLIRQPYLGTLRGRWWGPTVIAVALGRL